MPLVSNIHVDQPLTMISRAVKNAELVADKIWPVVPVKKDSDLYFRYDQANLRLDDTNWASKSEANEVDWEATEDSYKVERHALQDLVEDDEKLNADSPIDPYADSVEITTEKMKLRREKRLVTALTTLANYDAGAQPILAAADQWDNYTSANSDPNQDIATARTVIFGKIFKKPNVCVLPYSVYEQAREHPKILERIKYVNEAILTPQILARLWDIDEVIVAGAGENTADEGLPDSIAFMWGKNVYLGFRAPRPKLKMPSWGYHIQSQPFLVERWRKEELKGDAVRVSYKDVPKLVTKSAGYIIQSAIA